MLIAIGLITEKTLIKRISNCHLRTVYKTKN